MEDKARLEVANTARQLAHIEDLVSNGVEELRPTYVQAFHAIAVDGIFPCGGQYRTVTRTAELDGSKHVPPEPALVPHLVVDAIDRINRDLRRPRTSGRDTRGAALDIAAYALWRFNWIHQFAGGNGRTARALAYLILCIDFGRMIPGRPSWPTIIYARTTAYQRALRVADAADLEGRENLGPMTRLVGRAAIVQVKSVLKHAQAMLRERRRSRWWRGHRNHTKRAAKRRRGRRWR